MIASGHSDRSLFALLLLSATVLLLAAQAPAPAEEAAPTVVRVTAFRFTGSCRVPASELQRWVAHEVGKEHSLASLKEVARRLTAELRRRGYTLLRAYIPPQEVQDGVVEIAIAEARAGDVHFDGNCHYSSDFLMRAIAPAVCDGYVCTARLDRALLILNEFPDLEVNAVLQKGKESGTTDLCLHVEEQFPLHFTLDYNNFGTEFTGRSRFGAQIDWSNAVLDGATLTLRAVTGTEPDELLYGSAKYAVPLFHCDWKVGAWGYWGDFELARDFRELDVRGKSVGGGAFVNYAVYRSRSASLSAEAGLDAKDTELFILDEQSSNDEIRLARVALTFDHIAWEGHSYGSLSVAQGLGEVLGALEEDDRRASRRDADNSFTRVNLDVGRVQSVTSWLVVFGRAYGQASTDSLVAGEQMQIGGADTVRGYPQAEYSGDDGYGVSLELRVTPYYHCQYRGQIVAFVDHAGVHTKEPVIGQSSWEHITGAGVGLRLDLPFNVNFRFDVGWPLGQGPSSDDRPTYYFAGAVRF